MSGKIAAITGFLLGTVLAFALGTANSGETWHVDRSVAQSGDGKTWETAFKRIHEGIFAASDGDTVIVALGTYVENINLRGKNIVLRSIAPLDPDVVANTIIDGDESGAVATFSGDEDETCILTGFTIRNGSAWTDGGGICGGTSDNRTHATIRDNHITGNSAPFFGGGVACCNGLIRNNTIQLNSAYDGGGLAYCSGAIRDNTVQWNSAEYKAGGLFDCDGFIEGNIIAANNSASLDGGLAHCSGTIENNIISANSANWGGGIGDCNAAILRNIIIRNTATDGAGGVGGCNGIIRSNVVAGNSAEWGAGLGACDGMIMNNTIVSNSATDRGGGLIGCNTGIQNCIIWGNSAPQGPQLYDSSEPTYSCIQDSSGEGEGNIAVLPLFANPAGTNYRLQATSPCIDTGDNSVLTPPGLDRDKRLRIANGGHSLTVDMGAYEYGSPLFAITDFDFVTIPWPGGRRVIWNSQPHDTYSLWMRYSFDVGTWYKVNTVSSQGAVTSSTDRGLLLWNWRTVFYRVEME